MAKLGEVCLLKAGKFVSANDISPEYNKGLYPCFGGNGIRGYVADYTHDGEFPLIGRQGALCGNVNLASGKFHATEHAVVVQPKIEMNVHWLYYALNAMNLGQYATGAAQPGLAVSKLETLSIEIPNISEQNKIAQTLCKVEQLVNFRKQQLAKLDGLVKARFVEMFGVVHNSVLYPYVPVKSFTSVVSGGTPNRNVSEFWNNGSIRWVKTTELQNNVICNTDEKITQAGLDNSSAKIIPPNTVLIAMYGQGKTRGMTGYTSIECATNQACACILPCEQFNQNYLWRYMILSYDKLRDMAKGGNQPNLNIGIIKNFPVLKPPIELQNDFAAFAERVDQQKQTVQQSLEKLELMKKALMQEYFG
ncbi:restriction endonuclease subunit S [Faecalibacterium sp. BIOML-A3]|jgi:restriction endonuclease S subunit|uniref:restriction endonuclease subunit S n=1 Tax=unclassified Faecalibacterium TaxID=2646395 RepID=UPI0012AF60B1|nr:MULTISPECIES: restriction endonuclease subunit S [unclassified Faecalibacterium]MSD30002.1 restriction endonuclease subunit S [Faecalibacterium sp. BIOML-A4]MSD48541.1 restriction endonuclease subunit S [Faecalibacterium sp. BIOML-A3]